MFGAGPQEDMRGKGEVLPDGRVVRAWKGSSRVPGIDPDVWAKLYTTKEKRELIEAYEKYLKGVKAAKAGGEPPDLVDPPSKSSGSSREPAASAIGKTGPVSYTHLTLPTNREV